MYFTTTLQVLAREFNINVSFTPIPEEDEELLDDLNDLDEIEEEDEPAPDVEHELLSETETSTASPAGTLGFRRH